MSRIDSMMAIVAVVLAVSTGSGIAKAQDPVAVNAKTVHARLDNDRVRVLDAVLRPGEKERMHSHPAVVAYVITGGRIRNHFADGTSSEAELHAGDVTYRDAVTHWAENIGGTPVHLILVELKSPR